VHDGDVIWSHRTVSATLGHDLITGNPHCRSVTDRPARHDPARGRPSLVAQVGCTLKSIEVP
jgi:hypothetical protein